jgi:hypothetical protein
MIRREEEVGHGGRVRAVQLTEHQIAELWDGYAAGLHQSEILSAQVPSSS